MKFNFNKINSKTLDELGGIIAESHKNKKIDYFKVQNIKNNTTNRQTKALIFELFKR